MKTNLAKFYQDPDWVMVEEILKDCYSTLKYTPDEDTQPADFKAQMLANAKLKSAVDRFLAQAKIVSTEESSNSNPWE